MWKKLATLLFMALLSAGCTAITQPSYESHGYAPDAKDILYIKSQHLSQEAIVKKYGRPSVVGMYNDNYWYYITYRTKQYGFSKKRLLSFKIVEMYFKKGALKTVTTFDKKHLIPMVFATRTTRTLGKKMSIFTQLLSNVGRLQPIK